MRYFLAIDIGASSGRHILCHLENGKLFLEEIFRFKNGAKKIGNKFCWNHNELYQNIIQGLKKCKEIEKIPCSIGIDTWGVDYALLDENDNLIDEIYSYRDERTNKSMADVLNIIPEGELFDRTGIQKQVYNTIFQLFDDKNSGKLNKAKTLLTMPDYLNFMLTGIKKNEFSECSTTGLINAKTGKWDFEIIEKLGFNNELFKEISFAGDIVGEFSKKVQQEVGFNSIVHLVPSHDTASAIMAVPEVKDFVYISSGTWSLFGIETDTPITTETAQKAGFTNERGYNGKVEFLKNIMGLWMIQCVKKELNDKYSFAELVLEARKCQNFPSVLDVNDISFFAPTSMIQAVKDYCKKTNQQIPNTAGEIAFCLYNSLAISYKEAVVNLEKITGKTVNTINIVGGGCKNTLLNELTAKHTGKKVVAGPVEATAIGNILSQMLAEKEILSIEEGKNIIKNSFENFEY